MYKLSKYIRLLSTALAAIVMFCTAMSASAVTISKVVGVQKASYGSNPAAYTFVVGGDGNLYLNIFDDESQYNNWSSQGTPSGVSLAIPVGITAGPLAFITGTNGSVYARQDYEGSWIWLNTGKPSGVTLTAGYGAATNGGGNPMAFLQGSNGDVYQDYWNGSSWVWYNLGAPSGATLSHVVGNTVNGAGHPYVFFVGSDADLWVLYNNGSWVWSNLGHPSSGTVTGGVGVTAVTTSSDPMAMVSASDGHVWADWWNGSAWAWVDAGNNATITMALGAAQNWDESKYPWFAGFDNADLYMVQQPTGGGSWGWNSWGSIAAGVSPEMPVGVLFATYTDALVVGSDGNLWANYGGSSDWKNLGTP